jgi:dihydrofolate reductase
VRDPAWLVRDPGPLDPLPAEQVAEVDRQTRGPGAVISSGWKLKEDRAMTNRPGRAKARRAPEERQSTRRVRCSVAQSLDGYIAGPQGESDWIVMDPEIDFRALFAGFDTVLLGRKTYEAARAMGGGGMPGLEPYVFSRTLRQIDCPDMTVSDDPKKTLAALKEKPGKDIWLFGGGTLFRSLLDLGLVDTVEVAIIPVLLGGGVPLLPAPARSAKLELAQHRVYEKTGTVSLVYAVAR